MKLILHMIRGHRRNSRRHHVRSFLKNEFSKRLRHRKADADSAPDSAASSSRSSIEKDVFGASETLEPAPPTYSESLRSRAVSDCSLCPETSSLERTPCFTPEITISTSTENTTRIAPESSPQPSPESTYLNRSISPPQIGARGYGAGRGRPHGMQMRYKSQLNEFRLMNVSPHLSPPSRKPRLQLDLLKMQKQNLILTSQVSVALESADALAWLARKGLRLVQVATLAVLAFLMASAALRP